METQKTTNKYTKGKIYKIVCDTTGLTYIGSTIQGLSSRISGHRADYKSYLNKKRTNYVTSFDILKNNNYKIILIENFPCNSKEELEREERKYIETMDCINKVIPTRTHKEYLVKYNEENKEQIKEYHKEYCENNKERIKIQKKENYEKNKDKILLNHSQRINCDNCGCEIRKNGLARHKKTDKCINFKKI